MQVPFARHLAAVPTLTSTPAHIPPPFYTHNLVRPVRFNLTQLVDEGKQATLPADDKNRYGEQISRQVFHWGRFIGKSELIECMV